MLETEFIPAQVSGSRRLFIVLHGLGDSSEGYRWVAEALNIPSLNYLLVNAPDPYYGGYSWFDLGEQLMPGVIRSRKLLTELLDAQRSNGFPSEETVLGGFSQGCLMSIDVGLRYPHRLAGIVGISGTVGEPETVLAELSPVARQQRMLITHGTFDTVFPVAGVFARIEQLKAAGLKIEWRELPKPHTIAGELELKIIRDFLKTVLEQPAD